MTKIIKIHYPSAETEAIGTITASIRDQALKQFENARISYSFSAQKNSGYIMVYPTEPILSIRISNHSSDKGDIEPEMIIEKGNVTVINAEVSHGQKMTEAVLEGALATAERNAGEIRKLLELAKMG